ncbi:hypothetical protein [Cytobacillus purgationiresistens]|uniref:Uncharacterized protein n=1 Tax=Cytobacillus purgationiresistens TaxID=863449 RepID=A0ABU0AGH0_9BACI|nr:hypothetical protein [Cytobacillus purgationiresistens]MDQ0270354.1 hypothetical protein [Cytobacillus purgationiresistens]
MWLWIAVIAGPILIIAFIEETIQFMIRRLVGQSTEIKEKRWSKLTNMIKRKKIKNIPS